MFFCNISSIHLPHILIIINNINYNNTCARWLFFMFDLGFLIIKKKKLKRKKEREKLWYIIYEVNFIVSLNLKILFNQWCKV